jgi:pre-60S factor REI1
VAQVHVAAEHARRRVPSDWLLRLPLCSRYNLKRKVATLPAVTQEEFERRKTEVLARAAENNLASMSHVKEGKREKVSRKNEKKKQYAEAPPPPPTLAAAGEDGDRPEVEDAQGMEETLESLNLGDVDVSKFEIDLKKSIFDDHDSEESAYNMIYMQKNFGFFLPDAEYLVDPEGLLKYCALKVKAGRTCLYCQKIFASEQAVVNHMVEKAHCKLAYDTEEDVDEFEDFYDFSKTWEEFADDDEGEENWETASDDDEDSSAKAGGAEGASVQDTPDADAESAPSGDAKKKKKPPKITILESGEMLVKDGELIDCWNNRDGCFADSTVCQYREKGAVDWHSGIQTGLQAAFQARRRESHGCGSKQNIPSSYVGLLPKCRHTDERHPLHACVAKQIPHRKGVEGAQANQPCPPEVRSQADLVAKFGQQGTHYQHGQFHEPGAGWCARLDAPV